MAGKKVLLSKMRDRASFDHYPTLKEFMAEQLLAGRLSLALGAGASVGFGLPTWDDLTDRCHINSGQARVPGQSCEAASEDLLAKIFGNDEIAFAEAVRVALYQSADLSLGALRKSDLLAAVGALTMASSRGHVGRVISFNFDDTLETFLGYFGFSASSVDTLPYWQGRQDVIVLHPHGFLPHDKAILIKRPVVFAQIHYDKIVGKANDLWRNVILDVLRTTTCLFIGLSGNDDNLRSILADVKDSHASSRRGDAFWGIRFGNDISDPAKTIWENRGVFQLTVSDYSEIPRILFEVCQSAAEMRRRL